ncbi:hypothetical protein KI387_015253, partial [Taxus chinensis]
LSLVSERFLSLLDGYSVYNQIIVGRGPVQTACAQPNGGNFAYRKIPFGLSKRGATFQGNGHGHS